jgi:hypothetical protein
VYVQGIGTDASGLPGSSFSAFDGSGHLICASDCTNMNYVNGTVTKPSASKSGGDGSGGAGEDRTTVLGIVATSAAVVIPTLGAIFGLHMLARKSPAVYTFLARVVPAVCLPTPPVFDKVNVMGRGHSGPGSGPHVVSALPQCLGLGSKSRSTQKVVLSAFAFAESNDAAAGASAQVEQDQHSRAAAAYASKRWALSSSAIAAAAKLERNEFAQDYEEGQVQPRGSNLPSPVPFWRAKDQLPEMLAASAGPGITSRIKGSTKLRKQLQKEDDDEILNFDQRLIELDTAAEVPFRPIKSYAEAESEESKKQWQQDLLAAAQQSAALSRFASLEGCKINEVQTSMPAAVAAADGLVLLSSSATSPRREAILFRSNLVGVHSECLWPRQQKASADPAPTRNTGNVPIYYSNSKNKTAALSSGIRSRSSANCGGAHPSKSGSIPLPPTGNGGARLIEAGLPPLTRWGDEVVVGASASAASASAAADLQIALVHTVSRSFTTVLASGSQVQTEISPRDSTRKFAPSSNLPLVGGFSRDLRTPLEQLRASGFSSNVSGNSSVNSGTNGQPQSPAFLEILHRHYAAPSVTTGSRLRHGNVAPPLTINTLADQVHAASPRRPILFDGNLT